MTTTVIPSDQGENPTGEKLINTTMSSDIINVCSPYFDGVPQELKDISQWVVWNNNTKDTARGSKQPRHPSSPYAVSALDSNHWFDFDTACKTYEQMGVSGIGFSFTKEVRMTTIDVDDCVDIETDTISEFGQYVLDKFKNDTYAEISFHLDGIHIVTYGNLPEGEVGGHRKDSLGRQIEMYDCARFIAITGHKLSTVNAHVTHQESVLAELCEEFKCVVKKASNKPKNTIVGSSLSIGDKLGLRCMDIAPPYKSFVKGNEVVGCNPISGHENKSGTAYNVNPSKNTWHCWAHGGGTGCGGDALMLYAMEKGFISCGEEISDYAELFAALRDDGYNLDVLDPTYDPHCGDDLEMTKVDKNIDVSTLTEEELQRSADGLLSIQKAKEKSFLPAFPGTTHPIMKGWMDVATEISYARPNYHYFSLLSILSIGLGLRVKTQLSLGNLYSGVFVLMIGDSSVSGKSFSMNMSMGQFLPAIKENKVELDGIPTTIEKIKFYSAKKKMTEPKFIQNLDACDTMFWHYDECHSFFINATGNGNNSTILPELCESYDNLPVSSSLSISRKQKGDDKKYEWSCDKPFVSLLFAMTTEQFSALANTDLSDGGFLARVIPCVELGGAIKENDDLTPTQIKCIADLVNRVSIVSDTLAKLPVDGIKFGVCKKIESWKVMETNKYLSPEHRTKRTAIARSFGHAYKIAMILTLFDEEFLNAIPEDERGNKILADRYTLPEKWVDEALNIVDKYLTQRGEYIMNVASDENGKSVMSRIMKFLATRSGSSTKADIGKSIHVDKDALKLALASLLENGELKLNKVFVNGHWKEIYSIV